MTLLCKNGTFGETLKNIEPGLITAVTVVTMDMLKGSFDVVRGEKTRLQLTNELMRNLFVSSMGVIGSKLEQASLASLPVLGYMLGSFVGTSMGVIIYDYTYSKAIFFCIDTGLT